MLGLDKLDDQCQAEQTGYTSQRDVEEYRYQLDCEGQYPVPVIMRIPSNVTSQSSVSIHLADAGKASLLQEIDRRDAVSDGNIHIYADLRGFGESCDIYEYNLSKYWNAQYRSAVTSLHAGKPLVGQRVQDLYTLLNFCSSDSKLKGRQVIVYADGINAVAVMHAAVLDSRIGQATLTHTLKTWRDYIQHPMQHDMMSNVIPGVLQCYDIPDLLKLCQGRVTIDD